MTTAPPRSAKPPRPSAPGRGQPRAGRAQRPAPLTPPDTLKPTFSHAMPHTPGPAPPAPKPSVTPFADPWASEAPKAAMSRPPTEEITWLTTPFQPPAFLDSTLKSPV